MYSSMRDALKASEERNLPLWKVFQLEDCHEEGMEEEVSFAHMKKLITAMQETDRNYDPDLHSASGLVGGEAALLKQRKDSGAMICGNFIATVMEKALKTAAGNACMKRIVAAPTAGSCGVLPAVLLTYQEQYLVSDDALTEALYTAAGIGGVIARRASLSGAAGGCQAEIGSASAMAAGALVYLLGGNNEQVCNASALALKGLLGLACDPVAGLVEVPCVKRNVIGAVNAVTSAEMAMAGIASRVPADQVFDAMGSIGRHMPEDIRETAKGGLAACPEALRIAEKMKKL